VFVKSDTTLVLNLHYQVKKYIIDYTVTSFSYDNVHENMEKADKSSVPSPVDLKLESQESIEV
jgi:hypothetical protein